VPLVIPIAAGHPRTLDGGGQQSSLPLRGRIATANVGKEVTAEIEVTALVQ
jgi:hypothetical protein